MANTKNVSVLDEKKVQIRTQIPDEMEQGVVTATFYKFRQAADHRDSNWAYLDGLTPVEYIEDSVRRYTTNLFEREDIEDWQSRLHEKLNPNKVKALL
jgi:hypothetical protein